MAKLRELLDQKSSWADQESGSPDESKLVEEINAAKVKNAELTEKVLQKKEELSSLMTKRRTELERLEKGRSSYQSERSLEEDLKMSRPRGETSRDYLENSTQPFSQSQKSSQNKEKSISSFEGTELGSGEASWNTHKTGLETSEKSVGKLTGQSFQN